MSAMDAPSPEDGASDELFGKLDQLLRRQDATAASAHADAVPMLTEAVGGEPAQPEEADVPVLRDAVDNPPPAQGPPPLALDQLRLLQAALYLRLRQSMDEALQDAALQGLSATQRAQFAQALRRALPTIVRESVVQAFGQGEPPAR